MKDGKHVYDGIVEENHPMPGWWVWLFIFTVMFGFLYWLHYTIAGGPTLKDEYKQDMINYQTQVEKNASIETVDTEETLIAFMKNEGVQQNGAVLFGEKCAMCHGGALEGKIGPNLTDHFWIHGAGTRMDVLAVIKKGVAAKGMPAWEGILKPSEVKSVAAYIFTKLDSKPAGAKAAEGVEYK